MKTLAGLALAVVLAVAAGCRREPPPAPTPGQTTRELEFWHIQTYDPTRPAVERAVARAEAARPGLRVQAEAVQNDPFKTKLATAMGGGTPPDVFHTWGGGLLAAYAQHGRVLDLTDRLSPAEVAGLHPAARRICSVGDRLYALPVDVSFVPMWYRKSLFAQVGAAPPTTVAEWLDACAKLKAAGIVPLSLGNNQSWPGAFYFVYFATRLGAGEALAAGRHDDPAFIAAGEQLQALVKAEYFTPGANALTYDDARAQFLAGKAAMLLMGTWFMAQASKEASAAVDDIGFFAFPALGRNPAWDRVLVGGVNAGYAIAATTKAPDDALALLRHLTDATALREWAATGRLPAVSRAAYGELLGQPQGYAALFYDTDELQLYYDQLLSPALAMRHKETTQALIALAVTPAEAAQQMAAAARQP